MRVRSGNVASRARVRVRVYTCVYDRRGTWPVVVVCARVVVVVVDGGREVSFSPTRFRLLINGKSRGMCTGGRVWEANGDSEICPDPKRKHPIYLIVEDLEKENKTREGEGGEIDVKKRRRSMRTRRKRKE